jgi:hypothetical protein
LTFTRSEINIEEASPEVQNPGQTTEVRSNLADSDHLLPRIQAQIESIDISSNQIPAIPSAPPSILGSLETVSLQDHPKYVALSYVWGDVNNKAPFILDGNEIEITKNLAVALQHIQSTTETVTLWIDAVCAFL